MFDQIRAITGRLAAMALFMSVFLAIYGVSLRAQGTVELNRAIALHDAARDGDENAGARAIEQLSEMARKHPRNAVVLAYLGSAYAIAARDAWNPFQKTANVNRGLRNLDAAVEMAPENFVVRLIRANVQMKLPSMFARGDDAVRDMIALDVIFRRNPNAKRARAMIAIYEKLIALAPNQGDWSAGLALARQRAAGR